MPYPNTPEGRARRVANRREYYAKNRTILLAKAKEPEKRVRAAALERERRKNPIVNQRHRENCRRNYYANREKRLAQGKSYRPTRRANEEAKLVASAGRPRPDSCEVCGRPGRINFDHCHQLGHFRGWICRKCNLILGHAEDDPDILTKLVAYLKRTQNYTPPQLTLPGI